MKEKMKKIACLLLMIQSGFIAAQSKTVLTMYGEKVQINPNSVNTADNGLTVNAGNVQLGGNFIKPTTLVTTSSNTLALQGLQTGSNTDNVLVADANGVLKWVSRSSFTALGDNLGNHTATQNLNMNANSIVGANNITATGKTSTNTAAIKVGTNGSTPAAGYIATAADTSGNIIWVAPSVPVGVVTPRLMAVAKASNANTTFSTGDVWYDTKTYDPELALSLGTSSSNGMRYVVQRSGLHQVFVNFSNNAVTMNATWYLRIKKNGIAIAAIDATTASGASACVFATEDFNAGDVITVDKGGSNTGWLSGGLSKVSIFRFQ